MGAPQAWPMRSTRTKASRTIREWIDKGDTFSVRRTRESINTREHTNSLEMNQYLSYHGYTEVVTVNG